MNLLIVIPALNEEKSITTVISDVRKNFPDSLILVVNDGSTDSTAANAKIAGAKVISLPINIGVGGAIRVGFKFAVEHNFDAVLQIDADGQHPATEALKLLNSLKPNSLVIGSRFLPESDPYFVGKTRRLGMILLAKLTSSISGYKLTDVTSGFRLTTGYAIKIFAQRYPIDYLGDTVESIVIASKSGVNVVEVPIRMNQREFGNPSQNALKSIWYLLRVLLVVLLSALKR